MIEVIYKEDKEDQETVQEPFSMPRNVRQIGLTNGDYRIYVEDYVWQRKRRRKAGEWQQCLPERFNGQQI